jgi:zinc/manganese transport system permease protein
MIEALHDVLWGPFAEFGFMRRALVGCLALAMGAAPVGAFLLLRRMSLTGDAIAHAVLPGAAAGFLLAGLSLPAMTAGGVLAGLAVALLAGVVARVTVLREDASLAAFYLLSLALGVTLVSLRGSNIDLLHVLFGTVLALDDPTLLLLAGVASLTLLGLALLYRPLVLECVDPTFLRSVSGASPLVHGAFLALVVVNLVAGFHALGTLMAVGIMILPAATARLWVSEVGTLLVAAAAIALAAGFTGLLLSYHLELPSGPAVILAAGLAYLVSILVGPAGGVLQRLRPARHLEA